jgi:chloride channel protein, CIC family
VRLDAVEAYPDESLRVVVYRMAEEGFMRMPVLERGTEKFLGLVAPDDLFKARGHNLEEERTSERTLKLRFLSPSGRTSVDSEKSASN